MSDGFDTNLLSQITPLDRKLAINRERVSLFRKTEHHDHRKQHDPRKEAPPEETAAGNRGSPEGGEGTIDITI